MVSICDVCNQSNVRIVGNHMEAFGIYRLLIAVRSDGVDLDSVKDRFDASSFMQTSDNDGAHKPISYLTPDIPTGTNSIHFRHNCMDENKFFCWGCIARALCSLPAFCTVGGAGLSPSVNGGPPLYWLPLGKNIEETMKLNCKIASQGEFVPWRRDRRVYHQFEIVSFGHGLTFLPRRIHVFWLRKTAQCTRCGQTADLGAREMIFAPGDRRIGDSWRDPHVLYGKKEIPIRAFGHRTDGYRINDKAIDWAQFVANAWHRDDITIRPIGEQFQVFGAVTDKAKFEDVFSLDFAP